MGARRKVKYVPPTQAEWDELRDRSNRAFEKCRALDLENRVLRKKLNETTHKLLYPPTENFYQRGVFDADIPTS
jgi:regulator of replication initiation timing